MDELTSSEAISTSLDKQLLGALDKPTNYLNPTNSISVLASTAMISAYPLSTPYASTFAIPSTISADCAASTNDGNITMPHPPNVNVNEILGKNKGTTKTQAGMNGGRWTDQEHQSFLAGLRLYGREWKKVASKIKTRTSAQIRSHAQKYFAKLARDDDARKQGGGQLFHHMQQHPDERALGQSAGQCFYGYMSDDGSSTTTTGNNSGDDCCDTDSSTSQPLIPPHCFHPLPSAIPAAAVDSSTTVNILKSTSKVDTTATPLIPQSVSVSATKKRCRAISSNGTGNPALSKILPNLKQRKLTRPSVLNNTDRLPSPEELLEKVSPTVRQRLASLIEAEISALQVLSCYAWPQQQDAVRIQPVSKQPLHHRAFDNLSANNGTGSMFTSSRSMSLTMVTPERTSSIY